MIIPENICKVLYTDEVDCSYAFRNISTCIYYICTQIFIEQLFERERGGGHGWVWREERERRKGVIIL